MIYFNIPPYVGKEKVYISQAIAEHKICGDGRFTEKCNEWLEKTTKTKKEKLKTYSTNAILNRETRLLCRLIHLFQQQMHLF